MASKLLPFGQDIFTVDIQWYEPEALNCEYDGNLVPAMNRSGQLIPAPIHRLTN